MNDYLNYSFQNVARSIINGKCIATSLTVPMQEPCVPGKSVSKGCHQILWQSSVSIQYI